MNVQINDVEIALVPKDILSADTDCLVMVTDPNLTVDVRLTALAGHDVATQTAQIGWAAVGDAVMTGAGTLKDVNRIIHAVGPRWGEESQRGKLANVVWTCLHLAEDTDSGSIGFPPISVGSLGFPVESCARIMLTRCIDITFEPLEHLQRIVLYLPDTTAFGAFQDELERQIQDLKDTGEAAVQV